MSISYFLQFYYIFLYFFLNNKIENLNNYNILDIKKLLTNNIINIINIVASLWYFHLCLLKILHAYKVLGKK